jgi:AbrB family looped-hinge helix DNA binding protein
MVTAGKRRAGHGSGGEARRTTNRPAARKRGDGFQPVALAKVTSKGQITIPKNVRDALQLRPGDMLEFLEERGVVRIRRLFDEAAFDKWHGHATWLKGVDVDDFIADMRGE